jgi:uncharacterized protein
MRRATLRLLGLTGLGVAGLTGLRWYAGRVAPWQLSVERVTVPRPDLPRALEGLTIGLMSDLHIGRIVPGSWIRDAARRLQALNPDVIAVTGDLIHHRGFSAEVVAVLRELRAPLGVYVTFGNHDHWNDLSVLRSAIADSGAAELLLNRHVQLSVSGQPFAVVGVDDVWEGAHDLDRAVHQLPEGIPAVLLAHEPDFADQAAAARRFLLQVSGHTHGGQVRFPFAGAIALPPWGRKYPMGLYQVNGMALYVTRGVGMAEPPVRFLCPPEISLLKLTTALRRPDAT